MSLARARTGACARERRRIARACVLTLACTLALPCVPTRARDSQARDGAPTPISDSRSPISPPKIVGRLSDPHFVEISGLAASRKHADRYWLHNDSGDGAFLYAIDAHGALVGTVQIDGVLAVDWEDIASFERDGKAYLLVADSGDNLGLRGEYALIAIEEPELPADGAVVHVQPAWQTRYRYADAPHDTEAMTVDTASGNVLVLPKFVEPLTLFRVPLQPGDDSVQVAQHWATLTEPVEAAPTTARADETDKTEKPAKPKFRPTAFDLAADGRHAAVLGYRSAWMYERRDGESWIAAFARAPQRFVVAPPLRQPEAVGFSADGSALFVTGEGKEQPLLRVELPSR